MTFRHTLVLVGFALLCGCASRAERQALRSCTFVPQGASRMEGTGDSLRLSIAIQIHNPGTTAAVLDSFAALVSGNSSLAVLSHGGTFRILPGATDTVRLHLTVENAGLMNTAAMLALSPPDSLSVTGTAWVPGWFGTRTHPIQVRFPYKLVAGRLKGLFNGGFGPR